MLIAIPSKGRPYKSKSKELLRSAKLFVPEMEVEAYRRVYPDDVIGVPNNVKGITATRNWILRQNIGEDVVFVDDDLDVTGYLLRDSEDMFKKKHVRFKNESELTCEFEKLFEVCKSLGWKIWGAKTESSKLAQYDEKPFRFLSYITASCMGIVNDGTMFFDERFRVKEDYEIGLRHVKMFGGVLCAQYFYWQNEHWTTEGGCKEYRTSDVEVECIKMLARMYPQYVKSARRKNSEYCIRLHFDN